eukprot:9425530-Karenia_brevis.AAC.1
MNVKSDKMASLKGECSGGGGDTLECRCWGSEITKSGAGSGDLEDKRVRMAGIVRNAKQLG